MQGYGMQQYQLVRCSKPRSGSFVKSVTQQILASASPPKSGMCFFNNITRGPLHCTPFIHPSVVVGCFAISASICTLDVPCDVLKDNVVYSRFYVWNAQNWASDKEIKSIKNSEFAEALRDFVSKFETKEVSMQ